MPATHFLHAGMLVFGTTVPGLHSVCCTAPVEQNAPGRHSVQLSRHSGLPLHCCDQMSGGSEGGGKGGGGARGGGGEGGANGGIDGGCKGGGAIGGGLGGSSGCGGGGGGAGEGADAHARLTLPEA